MRFMYTCGDTSGVMFTLRSFCVCDICVVFPPLALLYLWSSLPSRFPWPYYLLTLFGKNSSSHLLDFVCARNGPTYYNVVPILMAVFIILVAEVIIYGLPRSSCIMVYHPHFSSFVLCTDHKVCSWMYRRGDNRCGCEDNIRSVNASRRVELYR